jgi:hypothetical protein
VPGLGEYWIKNQVSGKCLTIQNARTDNNAPVIQYPCNAGANEVWKYEQLGGSGITSWPDGTVREYLAFRIKPREQPQHVPDGPERQQRQGRKDSRVLLQQPRQQRVVPGSGE